MLKCRHFSSCLHRASYQHFDAIHQTSSHRALIATCRPSIGFTSRQPGYISSSTYSNNTLSLHYLSQSTPFRRDVQTFRLGIAVVPRLAHTSSNAKWLARQSSDRFSREAKVANLKSRAAFKLLQINERYRIFRPGMTVVDLGFAPGSWSQVAIDMVKPGVGRVVGVDVIPVQPPKGVNGMQGDFLSPDVQARVREFLQDESSGKMRNSIIGEELATVQDEQGYLDQERALTEERVTLAGADEGIHRTSHHKDMCVDVVLSDMSAPWEIFSGLWKNSISNPYRRMMNTTGNKFKDHAGSMDLCRSALYFSYETLKVGGSFVCKFYQGAEDRALEKQLRAMFHKVHREKPESSRSESRESFFVCLKRLADVDRNKVFDEG